MSTRRIALWLVALLAVAAVATALGAGASGVHTIDSDHPLSSDTAIQAYEKDGAVTAQMPGLDMSVTVSDDSEDVGLGTWSTRSAGRTFVQIDYREEISREIRIYLPSEYFSPRLRDGLSAEDGGADPIRLEPVNDRKQTALTVQLREPTTATYAVPSSRGTIASTRERARELINRTTGVDLPSLDSGGEQWQYIQASQFEGADRTTVAIETNQTDHVIQYDAAGAGDERWIPVRDCQRTSDAPVCTFKQSANSNTTYVLSTTESAPPVRYKSEAGRMSSVKSGVNDVINGAKRSVKRITDNLPGGGD